MLYIIYKLYCTCVYRLIVCIIHVFIVLAVLYCTLYTCNYVCITCILRIAVHVQVHVHVLYILAINFSLILIKKKHISYFLIILPDY